jgi:hypothetical protein
MRVKRLRKNWIVLIWLLGASVASAAGLSACIDLGEGRPVMIGDVGGHDLRRAARVVGEAGEASFEMRVVPDEPLTLEFEEIDGRGDEVRGYQVLVDEKPVYFRSWRQCGAGPVHFFVHLPPPQRDRVRVRLVNRATAPLAIARVWAWANLEQFLGANHFDVAYRLAPTVPLSGDIDRDRVQLHKLRESFGKHAHVTPAWTTSIAYAARSAEQCARRIDEVLQLADEFDLPVQICFDSWWASTPRGKWRGEEFEQVVWNETHRRMERSTPNRWSNTPWLTVNHPDLNAFKVARLRSAASYLAQAAKGRRHLVLAVNLDNEPIYWASGNAALGEEVKWADFNARVIAAAKGEGVVLDPRDGLSRQERLWLWNNLLHYNAMIAAAAVDGLRDEQPSDDPLADNVYTQAMMMSDPRRQFPMFDAGYPLWESAAPAQARVGGEWNGDTHILRQQIEHQIALGRTAAVNAECENDVAQHGGVRLAYAMGLRYYTPYNYPLDQLNVAAADVDEVSTTLPAASGEPTLKEFTFERDDWPDAALSCDGIVRRLIGNTATMAACPVSADQAGQMTYRIDHPPADRLAVEIFCRANDFVGKKANVLIRVLAGTSPDVASMRQREIIAQNPDLDVAHRIDLSELAHSAAAAFVRIELHAGGISAQNLSWCAVHRIRFTVPWPRDVFDGLIPQDQSPRRLRQQNLLVSWRRDAELAMARVAERDRASAREAYEAGRYPDAYHLAARNWRR